MTREQFTRLVEGTQGALRRFLTALCCGNAHEADDIAQEAFIKAYMALDSLNDERKFKAWIFRIAYNSFVSSRRSDRPTVSYDELADKTTTDSADSSFRYQTLYMAMDRLPATERSAVLLFYLENYSVKEIAETTGASPDAVRQHLSRGRKHLRNILESYGR